MPEENQKARIKKWKDHDPSMEMSDIILSPGWVLIQGPVVKFDGKPDETLESDGGIMIPVSREMNVMNVGRVLKIPQEPLRNKAIQVGRYVVQFAANGEAHNDRKAQPIYRDFFDKPGLYLIHEDNVLAVILPRMQ